MPAVTRRSSARLAARTNFAALDAAAPQDIVVNPSPKPTARKRKADAPLAKETKKVTKQDAHPQVPLSSSSAVLPVADEDPETAFVPAILSFNFEEAKNHLIQVDHRFEDLFTKMKCKPFEHLEQEHPFRAQQISWMAARSITHKFIRLFDPSVPENPDDEQRKAIKSFPTPHQVASAEIAVLRTAGLSGRKVEYVQDLAMRFADGRLSTRKLLEADDEELARMLIEVRGIGRVIDMFAMFSLRRPDILPVGDLGVQRGVVRWFLSLHSPVHSYSLSPEKSTTTPKKKKSKASAAISGVAAADDSNAKEEDDSNMVGNESGGTEGLASIPPAFTPSIKKTLNQAAISGQTPVPLPSGIDVGLLKARLAGKNKIKGAFLTPQEITALTECWKPYRSIGVYYMWSLAEATE
ncbi:DNA glycosylase [Flammula alnicola]|nr:DNA glycosylase [Flammula alnicola]